MKQIECITGCSTSHLHFDEEIKRYFHQSIYQDFLKLKSKAQEVGLNIFVLSSFRSFEDQLIIWNLKASGQRPVLDMDSNPIDISSLTPKELIFSILRWSALPGASRHHWGTDIDVYCKNSCPKDYDVQLIPSEYEEGGPFYKLRVFLDEEFSKPDSKFFRPYQNDLGGVAPEMWHISHKETSKTLLDNFSFEEFKNFYEGFNELDFLLLETVKENLEEIYERFVKNICS